MLNGGKEIERRIKKVGCRFGDEGTSIHFRRPNCIIFHHATLQETLNWTARVQFEPSDGLEVHQSLTYE